MMLMTKELERRIPALCSQENVKDPIVHVKLFCPWGAATWYLTEYSDVAPDGIEHLAFGLCDLYDDGGELGYVSLDELAEITGPMGLKIERDLYWTPVPLSQIPARRGT